MLLALTMAVGIASCMTAVTIFSALSGDPLPGISDHLYVVTMDSRTSAEGERPEYKKADSYLTLRDAKALVDARRASEQAALAQSYQRISDLEGKQSTQVMGLVAYGQALDLLGVPLRHGRAWTRTEEEDHVPVVVIDTTLAQSIFGTDDAVGRGIRIGQSVFRVIGVVADWKPRTKFLDLPQSEGQVLGRFQRYFVPAEAALEAGAGPVAVSKCGQESAVISFQPTNVDHCRWLELWVSSITSADVASYRSYLVSYANAQRSAGRFIYPPHVKLYSTSSWMQENHVFPSDVQINTALAGAFLLLCMINVTGLLAAHFMQRKADTAIRRALGATKQQLFIQHLIEAGTLGTAGSALALPLTWLGLQIVRMQPVAYADAAHFNPIAFLSLVLMSLAVGLAVGILPAWHISRLPPALQIKNK